MSNSSVSSVDSFFTILQDILRTATNVKPQGSIDPALKLDDLKGGIGTIGSLSQSLGNKGYAAIETAVRTTFYDLLSTTSINELAFGQVWNLLDVVTLSSDLEYCEPGLVFWLVEELLESQTIDGCRTVFDYLDSRRERLTAKHFDKKNLIILRACNDLLRRLSRAEDTVFCGRVFIFLFQSFPLGDKSSVNLRGEYHVENVTVYETYTRKDGDQANLPEDMDVDIQDAEHTEPTTARDLAIRAENPISTAVATQAADMSKSVKFESGKADVATHVADMDTLYEMFWSLQDYFSQPTKLFEKENLEAFKGGLRATVGKFREVQQDQLGRGATKLPLESKRGIKRKRPGSDNELASSFNPKYLTSRDLFDLEVSDLSFRRHILVQALILVDFLLSLTPKAKKKLEQATNRSVLYAYILNDDNAKWASNARNEIATYLQQGPEGKFYYRMVDTVLSRDKNWVHWKAEGCPLIARDPIPAENFAEAEKKAQKVCEPRRIRPNAMGALDLSFLAADKNVDGMDKFRNPQRFKFPAVESFRGPIMEDDIDIETAKDEETKRAAQERRASKLWRILRVAARGRLNVFDHIEDGNKLKPLFEPETVEAKLKTEVNGLDENAEPAESGEQKVSETQPFLTRPDSGQPPEIAV